MTDLTPAGTACGTRLADAVAGEVVLMNVVLRLLGTETVDDLLVADRAERRDREYLRLPAREKPRAVRARQKADLAAHGAHLIERTPVGTDLLVRDHAAHALLDDLVRDGGDLLGVLGIVREEMLQNLRADGGDMLVAVELVGIAHSFVETRRSVVANRPIEFFRREEELDFALLLAAGSGDLLLELDDALNLLVPEEDRFEDDFLGKLVRSRLDHHDGVVRAGNRQIQVGNCTLRLRRIDDEFAVDAADLDACDWSGKRDVRDAKSARSADHACDLGSIVLVDAEHRRDDLHIVAETLGKQRTDRTVDETAAKNRRFARAAFALDEAAWNLAGSVHLFFEVNRQRKEVDALARLCRRSRRDEHRRIAVTDKNGAVRLLRHLPVLDDQRTASNLHFKTLHLSSS